VEGAGAVFSIAHDEAAFFTAFNAVYVVAIVGVDGINRAILANPIALRYLRRSNLQ
jgi:hypothetical protein